MHALLAEKTHSTALLPRGPHLQAGLGYPLVSDAARRTQGQGRFYRTGVKRCRLDGEGCTGRGESHGRTLRVVWLVERGCCGSGDLVKVRWGEVCGQSFMYWTDFGR